MSTAVPIPISKLTEHNYRTWVVEAKDLLKHLNVWRIVDGSEIIPGPPAAPVASGSSSPTTAPDPLNPEYNFKPESQDSAYLNRFDNFLRDWRTYKNNYEKANGTICSLLEPSIRSRYTAEKYDDPKVLWDTIKTDFEKAIKLDARYQMAKLAACKLESYSSVTEWTTAQEKYINDLTICGVKTEDEWRKFYIFSNLPNTEEWRNFSSALELTDKADTISSIVTHLTAFEAKLRRARGLAPETALFVSKRGRGNKKNSNSTGQSELVCYGCGAKGHRKRDCRNKDKWAAYTEKKKKDDANLALATLASNNDAESFLFLTTPQENRSVITVDVASTNRPADYWIQDTGATNHVTGNRHLFESFQPMPKGEHQVNTASNSLIDAIGTGIISFWAERPNAKPVKVTLQHVLYVPACGTNNLLSVIQLMKKGVRFDFTLDKGAVATVGSTLVYQASLINDLFMLRTFPIKTSKASVAVLDVPNPVAEDSKVYSNIRQTANEQDIFVWHARLGHLSLPAIKRLPSIIKGIQLHSKSPSECVCEACIMGKMFRKPFQSLKPKDKVKSRPLELIHSDVIGPMQTQTMSGY
jgi:hypothetical protein